MAGNQSANRDTSGLRRGRPANAGKKKGEPNAVAPPRRGNHSPFSLANEAVQQAINGGITPLEFLLNVMREPTPTKVDDEDPAQYITRCNQHQLKCIDAAKAAAPYIHSRRQTIETKTEDEQFNAEQARLERLQGMDVREVARRVAFILLEGKRREAADAEVNQEGRGEAGQSASRASEAQPYARQTH